MHPPKQILVPIDFSTTSERALAYARALGKPFSVTLHLLHVITDPYAQAWSPAPAEWNIPSMVARWETEAKQQLQVMDTGGLDAERTTTVGEPFVEIIRYVKQHEIDLIVMGTHGRGPVQHMLLGSVAEKVVRKAPCPVLTVRDPGHTFALP